MRRVRVLFLVLAATAMVAAPRAQNESNSRPASERAAAPVKPVKEDPRAERLKSEAVKDVESMKDFTQQMVDSIFSFAELGFQEKETHRYLVDLLKKNGFTVQEGIAGIPTAFMATW